MHVQAAAPLNAIHLHPRLLPSEDDRYAAGTVETLPCVYPSGGDKEWHPYAARAGLLIPPKANGALVAAMEDVLAVYTRPRDPDCLLVCLDETSKQLLAETRVPIPMKAGRPARFDYEYERNGTAQPLHDVCSRSKAGAMSKSRTTTPPWTTLTS